jgi:chloramphenicol O-acetyltransferase type B
MKGDTIIGDGAWIGMRAMIMPGINIGEGAIVASGSIVTKDVEPYSIVAGNPAQKVKMRFSNEVIQELLNLKLYDLEPEKFNQLIPYLVQSDINLLKERYYHLVND